MNLNAWVSNRVEDIRQQVSQYDHHSQQHRRCLYDGVVPVTDRRDRELSDTRNVENLLDEEGTGDNETQGDTKDRHKRNHRVAQRVAINHYPFLYAFRPGGTHIILAQDL